LTISNGFPTRSQLWNGAILVSIAHAIFMTESTELGYEVSWDGFNYCRQDSQGTRGTFTFGPDGLIAVIRDDDSPKAPWNSKKPYSLEPFLKNIPQNLYNLAQKEALQYVLDEYNGYEGPVVTAAFWGTGEVMEGAEPWKEIFENGAHLIKFELMEPETAFKEIEPDYGFSEAQMRLLKTIYDKRIKAGLEPIYLTEPEIQQLSFNGEWDITESLELFEAINIKTGK
jgi:hypothetical protein